MNNFAQLFISKRKEKNLSQNDLAGMLNVTRQAVSKWERGKALPDMYLMPEIAKILGVTVDELLTGKEPEKEIIEKEVIVEKEVIKKPSVKRICAIVAPILIICVIASALMGVYIPKAIARNKAEAFEEEKEPPKPEKVVYKGLELDEYYGSYNVDNKAELIGGKAYYVFLPHYNSDYTLMITAPKNAVALLDGELIAEFDHDQTFEYTKYFNIPPDDDFTVSSNDETYFTAKRDHYGYKLTVDMTECSEIDQQNNSHNVVLKQKDNFADITIPANSKYCVALTVDKLTARSYTIKTDNVMFEQVYRQKAVYEPSVFMWCDEDYDKINYLDESQSKIDLILQESTSGFANRYYYIVLKNNNAIDIKVEIVENSIAKLRLNEWIDFTVEGSNTQIYYIDNYKIDDYIDDNTYIAYTKENDAWSDTFTFYEISSKFSKQPISISGKGEYFCARVYLNPCDHYLMVKAHEKSNFRFAIYTSYDEFSEL